MIDWEMKWKDSLDGILRGIERWFSREGGRWFGKKRRETPKRKEPETEGERALYSAMGWDSGEIED